MKEIFPWEMIFGLVAVAGIMVFCMVAAHRENMAKIQAGQVAPVTSEVSK